MDITSKKSVKKTTSVQFDVLLAELEANPDLARGAPQFSEERAIIEEKWKQLTQKVNAVGPPIRSVVEWKKIWADFKSRTKKKISENSNSMSATGGGPFCNTPLTENERTIDRILSMATAAAPTGQAFGLNYRQTTTMDILPSTEPTATPITTTSAALSTETFTTGTSTVTTSTTITESAPLNTATPSSDEHANLTRVPNNPDRPVAPAIPKQTLRGVKRSFEESIRRSAEEQAEAAKTQADAMKKISEVAKMQAESIDSIAKSLNVLIEILKNK